MNTSPPLQKLTPSESLEIRNESEHIKAKISEVNAILSLATLDKNSIELPILTRSDAILIKQHATILVKNNVRKLLPIEASETSILTESNLNYLGHIFEYQYQRQDLNVLAGDPYIGHLATSRTTSKGQYCWYATSGMAAIACIIEAIKAWSYRRQKISEIHIAADGYFETNLLLSDENLQTNHVVTKYIEKYTSHFPDKSDNNYKITWLDSSSSCFPLSENEDCQQFEKSNLLIIDSTCFQRGDLNVDRLSNKALCLGIPVLIVRSHMKLDFIGCEYARLGSVLFLLPGTCVRNSTHILEICKELNRIRSLYGMNSSIEMIYPSFHNSQLDKFNDRRVAQIMRNCSNLIDALTASNLIITQFRHNLFFIIELINSSINEDEQLSKLKRLARLLSDIGIPSRVMASFGSDYLGLILFQDKVTRKRRLRIAVCDFPSSFVADIALHILKWCNA